MPHIRAVGGKVLEQQIMVNGLNEIKAITSEAIQWYDAIEVADSRDAIANAKSILGLMALDYSTPVTVISENAEAAQKVCHAVETLKETAGRQPLQRSPALKI